MLYNKVFTQHSSVAVVKVIVNIIKTNIQSNFPQMIDVRTWQLPLIDTVIHVHYFCLSSVSK